MNLMSRKNGNRKEEHNLLSAVKPKEPVLNIKYETNNETPNLLSAVKPEEPISNTNSKTNNNGLKTVLRQKKKIKVYDANGKFYVEHSTAYALGLTNVRAIMMDTPKLVEIGYDIHNKLKNNEEIEIEYIKLEKKQKIKMFYNDSDCYIELGAAYALGLLSDEEFSNSEEQYYKINYHEFSKLKEAFDVEITALNLQEKLEEHTSKKR